MAAPQRKINITNSAGRDATVNFGALKPPKPPARGVESGEPITFQRFLLAAPSGLHEALASKHGEDYGQALIDGDPEADLERVGQLLSKLSQVYLSAKGDVLNAPPRYFEVIVGPDGEERERKEWEDKPGNVNDEELPLRWTGRKMKRGEVLRRFVLERTVQLVHFNGLTYDYLHAIARELDEEDAMMLVGAGERGRDPLVFQTNGAPYRAFLEGRVDGERYQLLMHLSKMELKRPVANEEAPNEDAPKEDAAS